MQADESAVLVCVDGSTGDEAALRWAVGEAGSRNSPLRVVCAYQRLLTSGAFPIDGSDVDRDHARRLGDDVVTKAMGHAAELDSDLTIGGEAVEGAAVPVLLDASARAALIVLGSRQLSTAGATMLGSVSAAVAARAACPAIVLRGPSGLREENPGVVVGVDGAESSEEVLAFAFDYASRRRVSLTAILCWHPDPLASMMWRSAPAPPARTEAWLSEALAGWREHYPDVALHSAVVRDHPAAGLVAASLNQDLLVVGSRGRHALVGTLLGSVSQGVLHHASCPVAVIPTHLD
jgi:nucleotide-binding universal stress UspA family protein